MEAAPGAGLTAGLSAAGGGGDRRPWLAFAALWMIQAALAAALPWVADEAYYLGWSRDLRWGYLDHPPGVAWWAALGLGHPRGPGLVLMPLAWGALADAARRWGVTAWRWVPALVMATPLGFSAGLLVTPDVPLVFCWCWALWGVASGRVWVVGLAVGAGLWAKSAMLVAVPAVWWVLGLRRGAVAVAWAAVVYAPHVAWSLANAGLPWSFQAGHRGWSLPWRSLPEAIGGQLLVVTPGWCVLAVLAWRSARGGVERVLRGLGLPILAAWLALASVTRVEANWPALAWPATLVLVLHRGRGLRVAGVIAVAMTSAAAVALPVLDAWAPIGAGPPRDGARLAACLADEVDARAPGAAVVAARYQEKALLDAAGAAAGYRRAAGHRVSEYDRRAVDAGPACGFVYLAGPAALAGRCAGEVEGVELCGRVASVCRCGR